MPRRRIEATVIFADLDCCVTNLVIIVRRIKHVWLNLKSIWQLEYRIRKTIITKLILWYCVLWYVVLRVEIHMHTAVARLNSLNSELKDRSSEVSPHKVNTVLLDGWSARQRLEYPC